MPSGSRLLPSFHKTCFARTIKTGVILKFRLLGGGVQIIILNAKILKNEGQKTLIFGQLSVKTILRKTNDYSTSLKIFICVTKNIWIDINLPRPWTPWGRVSWRAPRAWRRQGSGRRGRLAPAPPAATGWSWSGTAASWLPRHPLGTGEILAVSVFNWLLYKWRLCVKLTFENFLAVKNSCSQNLKWFDS